MADLGKLTADNAIKEHLYKILVIGEFGVGKSSTIKRYTEGTFDPAYKLTIGVDFALRTLDWNPNTKITLQLWIAAILVFDLTRPASFEAAPKWLEDVHSKVMLTNEDPIPVLLLANKCDLENAEVDTEMINNFCQQYNLIGWFPTSAKENLNIDEAVKYLVQKILEVTGDSPEDLTRTPFNDGNHVVIKKEQLGEHKKTCC